jgi:hypothetical protein
MKIRSRKSMIGILFSEVLFLRHVLQESMATWLRIREKANVFKELTNRNNGVNNYSEDMFEDICISKIDRSQN